MHEGLIIQYTKRRYQAHDQPHIFLRHLYPKWQDSFAALTCHKVSSANIPLSSSLIPQATTLRPVFWGKGESCQPPLGASTGNGSGASSCLCCPHRALCFLTDQNMLFNSKGSVATFSPKIATAKVKGCRLKNSNYPCNFQCFLMCRDVTINQGYELLFPNSCFIQA